LYQWRSLAALGMTASSDDSILMAAPPAAPPRTRSRAAPRPRAAPCAGNGLIRRSPRISLREPPQNNSGRRRTARSRPALPTGRAGRLRAVRLRPELYCGGSRSEIRGDRRIRPFPAHGAARGRGAARDRVRGGAAGGAAMRMLSSEDAVIPSAARDLHWYSVPLEVLRLSASGRH